MTASHDAMKMSEWTKMIINNLFLIAMMYASSIGMVFYQRWVFQQYSFPLFTTAYNELMKFTFSAIFRLTFSCVTGKERVTLTWKNNFQMMALLGATTASHLALSNFSLELNTVSLFTVSKSTSIIFILILVLTLRMEVFSWKMIAIVTMIALGMTMFTYKSTQMQLIGITVALSAAFMSALRWTMAQYVFQKSKLGIRNPIDLMYYVDLWVFIFVIPAAVAFEGKDVLRTYELVGLHIIKLATLSASTAFLMEVTKYMVLKRTSSITVSILGIVKEVATVVIACLTLGDRMSSINFLGLLLCISGVASHAIYKYRRAKKNYYDIEGGNEKSTDKKTIAADENNATNKHSYFSNSSDP